MFGQGSSAAKQPSGNDGLPFWCLGYYVANGYQNRIMRESGWLAYRVPKRERACGLYWSSQGAALLDCKPSPITKKPRCQMESVNESQTGRGPAQSRPFLLPQPSWKACESERLDARSNDYHSLKHEGTRRQAAGKRTRRVTKPKLLLRLRL